MNQHTNKQNLATIYLCKLWEITFVKGLPGEDREGIAKDDKDHVFKIYNSNNDGHIVFLEFMIQYFLINIATVDCCHVLLVPV